MKFKVITSCTAISEYEVEAGSEEEAINEFYGGEFSKERVTDWQDEEVQKVEQL